MLKSFKAFHLWHEFYEDVYKLTSLCYQKSFERYWMEKLLNYTTCPIQGCALIWIKNVIHYVDCAWFEYKQTHTITFNYIIVSLCPWWVSNTPLSKFAVLDCKQLHFFTMRSGRNIQLFLFNFKNFESCWRWWRFFNRQ